MGFTSGLLAGLAEGANEVISKDIEAGKKETQMLAKLRAERTIQRNEQREERLQQNIERTERMAARIGAGSDVILRNFIGKYGVAGAEEATTNLLAAANNANVSPATYAGLAIGTLNRFPTQTQIRSLAQSATAPVREVKVPESEAGGWSRWLGVGGPTRIKELSESLITSGGGISEQDTSDLPEEVALPGLEKPYPVIQDVTKIQEGLVKQLVSITAELQRDDLSEEDKIKLLKKKTDIETQMEAFGNANRILSGSMDSLQEAWQREVSKHGENSTQAKGALQRIKLYWDARDSSSGGQIRGSTMMTQVRLMHQYTDQTYKTKDGLQPLWNPVTGKVMMVDEGRVEMLNNLEKMKNVEKGIQMILTAPNRDQLAIHYVDIYLRPELIKRRKADADFRKKYPEGPWIKTPMGRGKGVGDNVSEKRLNIKIGSDASVSKQVDTLIGSLQYSGVINEYISAAKAALNAGKGTPAYKALYNKVRRNKFRANQGALSQAEYELFLNRLSKREIGGS